MLFKKHKPHQFKQSSRFKFDYLRELLLLQILCDSRFKVLCITFIQAVNLASLLDLYIPIYQDKFAD